MCAKWKQKGYDPALLCDRLSSIKQIKPDGSVSYEGFVFSDYTAVIATAIEFDNDIPSHEHRSLLIEALFDKTGPRKIEPKAILGRLAKAEQRYLNKPSEDYVLLTSLSVQHADTLRPISVLGCRLTFSKKLPRGYDQSKPISRASDTLYGPLPERYTYVRVQTRGRTLQTAANHALDTLDILRGIWNLHLNNHRGIRYSSGKKPPVNQIIPGPLHTLHLPGGQLATDVFWYEPSYLGPISPFEIAQHWDNLRKFDTSFRRRVWPSSRGKTLRMALAKYARALDSPMPGEAFLDLWVVLELLTCTEMAGYDDTVKRAAFIFQNPQLHKNILQHLREQRNRAVHEGGGSDHESEIYLFQLKYYVEELIVFLFQSIGWLRTDDDVIQFLDQPRDMDEVRKRMDEAKTRLYMAKRAIRFRRP